MEMPTEQARESVPPALGFALSVARTRNVFSATTLRRLERVCHIVDPVPLERFDDARAQAVLAQAKILVTGWGCPPIDRSVVALAPRLRLIAHAAGTVKTFIAREILAGEVIVTHAAAANALPVAEFTLAAIVFANKHVFRLRRIYAEARSGIEPGGWADEGLGNYRKVIGIIGASLIGRRVIELLRPFDFAVLLYDPFVTADHTKAWGVELCDLDTLMATSDIVSLHAPALPTTRHMIDAQRLARLRDGATLINTARGWLVDQAALEAELITGRLDAVIDVTEPEILPADSPLYALPNVLLTPHIAGALGTEQERLGDLIVAEIERYVRGEPLLHAIRPERLERMA